MANLPQIKNMVTKKINYFDTPEDRRKMGSAFNIYKWLMGGDETKQASEETDNTVLSDHERAMEDKASELQDEFTGQ